MPDVKSRSIPRWKPFAGIFGGLGLLIGVFALWIGTMASRRWSAMEREVLEAHRASLLRSSVRPVLRGAGEPGNAWDDYSRALAHARSLKNEYMLEIFGSGRFTRKKIEKELGLQAPALALLRQGAGRSEARLEFRNPSGRVIPGPNVYLVRRLSLVASVQARFWAEQGRAGEAAELLLDTMQLSGDLADTGRSYFLNYAESSLRKTAEALLDLILSGQLGERELLEADRELELLDRRCRDLSYVESVDVVEFGLSAVESPYWETPGLQRLAHWRFGFSDQLLVASAYRELKMISDASEEHRTAPWKVALNSGNAIASRASTSPNEIMRSLGASYFWGNRRMQERRARLRLLRIAAHYRATGEMLDLADPFGDRILIREDGCRFKAWSVGPDGLDHGGQGDWRLNSPDRDITIRFDR